MYGIFPWDMDTCVLLVFLVMLRICFGSQVLVTRVMYECLKQC